MHMLSHIDEVKSCLVTLSFDGKVKVFLAPKISSSPNNLAILSVMLNISDIIVCIFSY